MVEQIMDKQIMDKQIMPVVFATDDNYVIPCYVAMYSLFKNVSDKYRVNVYILHRGLKECNIQFLESLTMKDSTVTCMDISDDFQNLKYKTMGHLTEATYYRFVIPKLFAGYSRVLYLDSDLCITGDVAELFDMDIGGYIIGAVQEPKSYWMREHFDILNIDMERNFNSGVLIIDTARWNDNRISDKCIELLDEDIRLRPEMEQVMTDQDALNAVLGDNYYKLNSKWNYIIGLYAHSEDICDDDERYQHVAEYEHAIVIHYTGLEKPWICPDMPYFDAFWNYVYDAGIYRNMLSYMTSSYKILGQLAGFMFDMFPFELVPCGSRIVLYAAGKVGKTFYGQLKTTSYADIVGWVDNNYQNIDKSLGVLPVSAITQMNYDYVVVAINDANISSEARNKLIDMGVAEDKIIHGYYTKGKDYSVHVGR